MGQIIEFSARKNSKHERVEALVKGNIECYVCEDCGGDIEVINNKFPTRCPNCGVLILEWDNTEEE